MAKDVPTELWLIRHAPALTGGRMAGRRDVAADCSDAAALAALRARTQAANRHVISPALRCQQTAEALWPGAKGVTDARLWEQDFGRWEGMAFADLPDLGDRPLADLAAQRPPEGESFLDVFARVAPALQEIARGGGPVAVLAHAGVIRAGLGLALGAPELGLAFQVAPLSLTRILVLPGGKFSIAEVNGCA